MHMQVHAFLCVAVSGAAVLQMDVLPHSLGIELANGNMSVVIRRNTTIPYQHTRTYYNNEDNQTEVDVEVRERENELRKRCCGTDFANSTFSVLSTPIL